MRRTTRLAVSLTTLALAGVAATVAPPVGAAPTGGGCSLSGTAKFSGGPNNSAHAFTYTFTGTLSSCQSNPSGPASGTIATLVPAKGGGTCALGNTSGTALVVWADKTTTIIDYTTQSTGPAVQLQGRVLPSFKVKKKVYKTTRDKGDNAFGYLAFQASPVECAGSGVTSAGISGIAGLNSNS